MPDALPANMTAIEIIEPGGPEVLVPCTRPVPEPGAGEVLINVAAAGINRADTMQREGRYPMPPGVTDIPGLECAGTVAALGEGVDGWKIGEALCALVSGGGYAEYCTAPAPNCLPVPLGLDLIEAGTVPETFFTVWDNIFVRGHLAAGEILLVHGGSSGIGTTAIQLSKAFGARALATARTAEKCAACEALGAERAINYLEEDFVQIVKEVTGGKGVDVILDIVGGDYVARNLASLAIDGRLVQVATQKGRKVEIDVSLLMRNRLTFFGTVLRARSVAEKAEIAAGLREKVWPLFETGALKSLIHTRFPLAEAKEAHVLMDSSEHIGKIVLVI